MDDITRAERDRFVLPITCPNCGQVGSVAWEEAGRHDRARGAERALVGLSNGFHREAGLTVLGSPRIVCDHCDSVQPD